MCIYRYARLKAFKNMFFVVLVQHNAAVQKMEKLKAEGMMAVLIKTY